MPNKPKTKNRGEQLELFPHWDPRQLPLFPPAAPRRCTCLDEDELERLESIGGPTNERIWEAEYGT